MKSAAWARAPREFCRSCRRSPATCYCAWLKPFDPGIKFVILIHGREAQKKIATGRLAHRCLSNSVLLEGASFEKNARVEELLRDQHYQSVVLYPGENSLNLTALPATERAHRFTRPLQIFVLDGTWSTAPKMLEKSKNLLALPKICFDPAAPSRFRVRKQPEAYCLSTVEAIHQTIDLLNTGDPSDRRHDTLLEIFDEMVRQQMELARQPKLYCQWSPKKKKITAPNLLSGS